MANTILVLNAGSSSVKFALFDADTLAPGPHGQVEGIGTDAHFVVTGADGGTLVDRDCRGDEAADHEHAVATIQAWLRAHAPAGRLVAVGHRIVHGGGRFVEPVLVDDAVLAALDALVPLAPLHQPHNLAAIRAIAAGVPQVACFDTAFHRTQPDVARDFGLPRALTEDGIRRYGFHGLSYEYIASALPRGAGSRVVVAHLGNGASMCAMRDGRSVATTMGFSVLDGLVMGTRPGSLDPGVLLHLLQAKGYDAASLETLLYEQSGLLGVSGVSSDMRALLASDDPHAAHAVDLFVYRIGRELGSLAAALGGLDALIFTGGIGEHAAPIRARVCRDAAWLGIVLDDTANAADGPHISSDGSAVPAWVVPTDENLVIARHTQRLVPSVR
ncbi:MAG TPA: acetate/propionate family kinase [Candidatus Binatia bacterium]|jgi:acetate kinase|nr:acetate/propionate family kinase [Candidatus Binatia bacterium]